MTQAADGTQATTATRRKHRKSQTATPAAHVEQPRPTVYDEPPSPNTTAGGYRNRIVGHGEVDPTSLLANPKNWRIHPSTQEDALAGVLAEVGWVDSVLVNQRTGFVIDGHLRVAHSIGHGEARVPVDYVDVSEEEEDVILATFDPISALASVDQQKLADLLAGAKVANAGLASLLESMRAGTAPTLDELLAEHGDTPDDHAFWPVIRVLVAPQTAGRFKQMMAELPGDDDATKFAELLERASAA